MRKGWTSWLPLLVMLFSLAACGETADEKKDPPRDKESNEASGFVWLGAPEEVLIAPALGPAEVEPVYDPESMDSVYVPDLGAAAVPAPAVTGSGPAPPAPAVGGVAPTAATERNNRKTGPAGQKMYPQGLFPRETVDKSAV